MTAATTCSRTGLFALGACLALGMIISTWIGASAVVRVKLRDTTVRVKGYAEKSIAADLGIWSATLTTRGGDLATAHTLIESHRAGVLDYLRSMRFDTGAVGISPVGIEVKYRTTEKGKKTKKKVAGEKAEK